MKPAGALPFQVYAVASHHIPSGKSLSTWSTAGLNTSCLRSRKERSKTLVVVVVLKVFVPTRNVYFSNNIISRVCIIYIMFFISNM